MTSLSNNSDRGFTLIELLVVVLIIGILSAVALPQYQRAVEKSRAAQALTLLKSLAQAQGTYHLANGSYATQFDELSVDIPWDGSTHWRGGSEVKDVRSNKDWAVELFANSSINGIFVGRISGKYQGTGFVFYFSGVNNAHQILCAEREDGSTRYIGTAGDYCQKIMRGAYTWTSGLRAYTLP